MKNSNNTIEKVREESAKLSKQVGDRVAVIVETVVTVRKSGYGIQYWTKEMIVAGKSTNTDRSESFFVEAL